MNTSPEQEDHQSSIIDPSHNVRTTILLGPNIPKPKTSRPKGGKNSNLSNKRFSFVDKDSTCSIYRDRPSTLEVEGSTIRRKKRPEQPAELDNDVPLEVGTSGGPLHTNFLQTSFKPIVMKRSFHIKQSTEQRNLHAYKQMLSTHLN